MSLQSSLPTGVLIDATGATASELTYIYANQTKVGSITNLTLNLGTQTQNEVVYLLSKASTGTVKTDITGANAINNSGAIVDYASTLATNASKFATGGLTGTGLTLTQNQFAALGTKFATSVTDVTVNAASSDSAIATTAALVATSDAELAVVSANIGRVGLITGVTVRAATQTDVQTENLLAKSFALDAKVIADGASTNEVASIASNISRIASGGISTTSNALEVTPTQFTTLSTKLATVSGTTNTVTVDVSAGATVAQLTDLSSNTHANVIKNLTTTSSQPDAEVVALLAKTTGTNAVVANSTVLTATEFNTHQAKLASTTAVTVAADTTPANLEKMSDNIGKVYSITGLALDLTVDNDTVPVTGVSNTDANNVITNNLLSKAAAGTATVAVGSVATEAEIDSMVTHNANIATNGITGTALTVTDTQFATLYPKLNSTITTLTVNAAGATLAEQQTISAQITLSGVALAAGVVDQVTNAVVNTSTLTDTETAKLLAASPSSGTGQATVFATGATTAEITSVVTNIAKVAANGITGALTVVVANDVTSAGAPQTGADTTTNTSLDELFAKYVGTTATVDLSTMTASQITVVANAAGKIATGGVTGVPTTITDTQFATLGSKFANSVTTLSVDATGATASEVIAINTDFDNISTITGVGGATVSFDATNFGNTRALTVTGSATTNVVSLTNFSGTSLTATSGNPQINVSLGTNTSTSVTLGTSADTVNVGGLTLLAASTLNGGGTAANTLVVRDGANISAATVTSFANLTFDATGVSGTNDLTLNATQHAAFSGTITAAGTGSNGENITITDAFTGTGLPAVENYVLGAASTFTLGAAAQNVTVGAFVNSINVAALTATGTFTGLTADDTVVMATGSSIAGVNGGAATGAGIVDIAASASVSMTAAQDAAFTTFTNNATQQITLTTAATALALNANIETYVLANATNSVTQGAVGQIITGSNGADTVTAITGVTSTSDLGGGTNVVVVPNGANISAGVFNASSGGTVGYNLDAAATATLTAAQAALITSATQANEVITLSNVATGGATLNSAVKTFSLATGGNNVVLGAAGQNVTIATGSADTVSVGGFTATGTFTTFEAADTVVMTTGASISGVNAGAATGAGIANITGSVTMTAAQHAAFTTITASGVSDQVTLSDAAAGNVTAAADIETYVVAGTSDVTVNAAKTSVSITGDAGNQTVTVGGNTVTGTYALGAGTDVIVATTGANISGVNAGAVTTAETLSFAGTVTMTAAQYAGFATFTAAGATDAITLTTATTNFTGDAAIETYTLGGTTTNAITFGSVAQTIVAKAGAVDTITNNATTAVLGTVTGFVHAEDFLKLGGTTAATGILTGAAAANATAHAIAFDSIANLGAGGVSLGNSSGAAVPVHYAVASDTGAIWYDADGNWTAGSVQIGAIGVVTSLAATDFLVA
ncbi:MAG: hypothetical protein PHQ03_03875 [Methylococcales bacterium]|nr:hypothetical protein [Methylococcales bacterium]